MGDPNEISESSCVAQWIKERELERKEEELLALKDDSDTQVITIYEEHNMRLRHVPLDEYENRLKRFIFKKPTAKRAGTYEKNSEIMK